MGGKSSTITSAEERILSLQVQQSSQGLTLPVIYGRTRVAGNLVWYGDFVTIEHKTTTRQGGKGGGGVKQVDISYTYEAAVMLALCEGEIQGVGRIWRDKEKFDSLAQLRMTLMRGGDEQPLWTHLQQAKHQDQALNYSGTAYLCSPNYELTKSAQIYQHNFEVIGKLGYSGNIPDANPREIVLDLLTNQRYGCGFPSQNIGDTDRYSNYCRAVGIFLSPAYTEQGEAQRNISELLEQTNSAAVFSQGRLKIIPYGDGSYSGNGAVYVADNKAVYDLTDDDFIVSGAQDPVKVERKTNADAFNQIQVEYLDRDNDYNVAIAEVKDQANIEQYGLRPKDAVKMHGICNAKVAQKVAQQLLQRALYVRNEYEFKLGWKYCLLEPMDIVTLTDAGLGLNKTPVRITEIEEDEEGVLSVKAEDYPVGVYTVSEYPTQPSLGYSADYNVSPGNAHVPVIFEAPLQLTGGEPQIWLATAGGDMWGGAEVWVSTDGDSYTRVGAVNHKARFGSLTAALPNGAVFDRTNTLGVEISAGQLTGGTEQDSRDLLTLCYVDGEFLAYANAELKGVGRYTLGNLTRGAYGSTINVHAAGSQFARIDEALFKYAVPRNWIGRTVWVKLVSYNVFSGGIQDLAEVPAYSYTIKGAPLGQIQNLRLTSSWAYGKEAVIAWDKLDGADTYDVEIYAGDSQRRLRAVDGIVGNSYTYTQADMRADGGQVRDIVFKVRGRAVTGKTGNWAQIAAQNPQLAALQGIAIDSGLKQAFFTCQKPAEEDFAGIIVWVSENAAVPTTDANKVYDGAETFITIAKCDGKPLEKGKTYYLRAAGYDSFGKDNLKVSISLSFTVYDVSTTDLSESNLNQALRDKINLIDGNGAGSVNERVAAVRSTADGNTAAVQAHARSINGLEAQYTVKVDANGKVAGFGLATTPKNGTPESGFIVNADRFGIGATGKADVFPFVVDTQKNRVGVNGELVVNGKAVVDNLNAGDIHGDKITANTLDANRLKAGSVTAREIGAGSITAREIGANAVTADKIQVADLSAVSSNLGSITGGSLNIGEGNFTVSSDGILTANNAVIRGRIEADSGYFNGTVRASSIEGDVMKAHRLRWTEGNTWVLDLDKDPLPRVLIPNLRVVSDTDKPVAKLMLNGEVLKPWETKENVLFEYYSYGNRTYYRYEDLPSSVRRDGEYKTHTGFHVKTRREYPIQIIPAGKPISLKLTLASNESVFSPFVSVSYLAQSDYEYKQLLGRMVWRTFAESFRYDNRRQVYLGGDRRVHNYQNQMTNHWEPYGGLLQLPDNIYGISFEYRLYTNGDWSTMITFDRSDAYEVVRKYRSSAFGQYFLYEKEFDTAIPKSNLLFFVQKSWQYIELRNIRVLIPESRENEVWQVG
ncbi:phage tail protein [Neisseria lactamica]|uniref:phage tail protein n=1 Tax=Neisseria lactamica TaxID=486 RepID=UPI000E591005|nr:phage tail protein [Neisseria lactamica]